jgi:hypothetical protein
MRAGQPKSSGGQTGRSGRFVDHATMNATAAQQAQVMAANTYAMAGGSYVVVPGFTET